MVDAIINGKAQTNDRLRKALQEIYNLTNSLNEDCAVDPVEIRDIAKAALAEPVKNCEVGTWKEQRARWDAFCDRHGDTCETCPLMGEGEDSTDCFVIWAQMPYEAEREGGNYGQ